jgi:hypothetical protein
LGTRYPTFSAFSDSPWRHCAEHSRQEFARLRADPTANETAGKRAIRVKNAPIRANHLHGMFGGSKHCYPALYEQTTLCSLLAGNKNGKTYGGRFLLNASMVAVRIALKASSFSTAIRFTIKLSFAVNNFTGRA